MGKEARAKRMAGKPQAMLEAGLRVHITDREAAALVLHCIGAQALKDHGEQMRLFRTFQALDLMPQLDMFMAAGNRGLALSDFSSADWEVVEISRSVVDHVLEITNHPMAPLQALVLAPLVQRLRSVLDGSYVLPESDTATSEEGRAEA